MGLEDKLHSAIQTGCLDIVKQLVKEGANMDHVLGNICADIYNIFSWKFKIFMSPTEGDRLFMVWLPLVWVLVWLLCALYLTNHTKSVWTSQYIIRTGQRAFYDLVPNVLSYDGGEKHKIAKQLWKIIFPSILHFGRTGISIDRYY